MVTFSKLHVAGLASANKTLHPRLIDDHGICCSASIAVIESIARYNITFGKTIMLGTDARGLHKIADLGHSLYAVVVHDLFAGGAKARCHIQTSVAQAAKGSAK